MSTFNPKNYYFLCYINPQPSIPEDEEASFIIVPKDIWDTEQRMNDQEDEDLNDFLRPHNFHETGSSSFEYVTFNPKTFKRTVLDYNQGRDLLRSLGLIENPDMNTGPAPSTLYPPV